MANRFSQKIKNNRLKLKLNFYITNIKNNIFNKKQKTQILLLDLKLQAQKKEKQYRTQLVSSLILPSHFKIFLC